jgi:poly-beta-1,6-N-acetyl-D-glucosamine synthase
MAAQTRRPDLWVVVDDGSTDRTPELLQSLEAELAFLRVIALPRDDPRAVDGLAEGRVIRAFNAGWNSVAGDGWDVIAKVDGDIVLPPDYFARLTEEFQRRPRLGMAGGHCAERRGNGGWQPLRVHEHQVP